ncbi:hypothetical protein BJY52DRAFT_1365077 [Lactarius psammicola]|nr:hypothetical protein BJY52DRAFT_1365077 [Lactarius psammicola]
MPTTSPTCGILWMRIGNTIGYRVVWLGGEKMGIRPVHRRINRGEGSKSLPFVSPLRANGRVGWGPLPIPAWHSVRVSPLRRPGGGAPFAGLRAAPVRMPPLSVQTGTGRNGERRANPLIPASHSRVALHATGGVGALAGLRLATVHVPPLRANEGGRTQMMGWREPPPLSSLRGQLSRVALCAREVEGGEKGGSSFTFPRGLVFACSLWVQKGGWGGRATPVRPPLRVNGDEAKEGGTPSDSRANGGGRCKGERNKKSF